MIFRAKGECRAGETGYFQISSAKLSEEYVKRDTDYVVCLVDMDRLLRVPAEMATYQQLKKNSPRNVIWIETNPCTEFWFLLHFLPQISTKHYESYEDVLPDLQRFMPGYEKTAHYFRKNNLYKYLTEHGDLQRAIDNARELTRLSEAFPEDKMAYSQMHLVFELIKSMDEEEADKTVKKWEIKIEMTKIGDKSLVLSPIKGFQIQNPFQKPLDSSPQEPAITSSNSWTKVSLR